jgi:HK97 family phage portal protein
MGIRSWLLQPLTRSIASDFISFAEFRNATHSGVGVTSDTAVGLPAVYRCQSINSDVVSTLPLTTRLKRGTVTLPYDPPSWAKSPNDDMDFPEFLGQVQTSLEQDGNAFALKASTRTGRLEGLYPLNPNAVRVEREGDLIVYYVRQYGGEEARVMANEMLHIRGFTRPGDVRGVSPIAAMKETIGLGLAAQQFGAQFFGQGATMSGLITMTGNMPDQKVVERIQESMTRKHGGLSKSHAIGILSGGAQWVPLSVSPEESQFLETRKFNAVEIACAYGVPAWFVTEAEGAKGYVSGLYATMSMWLLTGMNPRLRRMERALSALLPDKNAYFKFNRNAFLSMDPSERAEFYSKGLIGRYMTPNEIREKEDMDPLDFGDAPLWSVQWQSNPYTKP